MKFLKIYLSFLLLFSFLYFFSARAEEIEDVVKKYNLLEVGTYSGDLYSDGKDVFVCVQTDDRKFSLWKPRDDTWSERTEKNCVIPDGLHRVIGQVQLSVIDKMPPDVVAPLRAISATYAGGAQIYGDRDLTDNRCGPNITMYFTLKYNNGKGYSFYIISSAGNYREISINTRCWSSKSGTVKLKQEYGDVGTLQALDIGDGRTILYTRTVENRPILLLVTDLPETMWSSGRDVFLVPRSALLPELKKAGGNVLARYQALLKAIGRDHSDPQKTP